MFASILLLPLLLMMFSGRLLLAVITAPLKIERSINQARCRALLLTVKQKLQYFGVDRFCQMMIESRCERTPLVGILAPASYRNKGDVLSPRLVPNALGQRVAGQIRHADIKY